MSRYIRVSFVLDLSQGLLYASFFLSFFASSTKFVNNPFYRISHEWRFEAVSSVWNFDNLVRNIVLIRTSNGTARSSSVKSVQRPLRRKLGICLGWNSASARWPIKMSVSCNTIRDNVTLRKRERERESVTEGRRREATLNSLLPPLYLSSKFVVDFVEPDCISRARNCNPTVK